jgi:predicted metalloprotease with PDZ domain
MRSIALTLFWFLIIGHASVAQTAISIDLQPGENQRLTIRVYPPSGLSGDATFIIPDIIPGTYMSLDYQRFYHEVKAYDTEGHQLKVNKKRNIITVKSSDHALAYLEYNISMTLGDGPIWKEVIGCAGTIFDEEGFLFNFQAVNGYFEGFRDQPFTIFFHHANGLYGISALAQVPDDEQTIQFHAEDYDALIDHPVLLSRQPADSFTIGFNRFHIGVVSESGHVTPEMYLSQLEQIMKATASYSGFNNDEDYYFLFYHVDSNRLKGIFSSFGIGSALEHHNSSVYLYADSPYYAKSMSHLNHIVPHEYLHTIAPLNLHSEKIHDFSFREPDMSAHLWMYEGVTDYLASQLADRQNLGSELQDQIQWAINYSQKRKERSMTKSSQNIISNSVWSWPSKMLQLINFYEKGKLLAWALDIEMLVHSDGKRGLLELMLEMKNDHLNSYIEDDKMLSELVAASGYPDLQVWMDEFIAGSNPLPIAAYAEQSGWQYQSKGNKVWAHAKKLWVYYNFDENKYRISKTSKNQLGLEEGDLIHMINGQLLLKDDRRLLDLLLKPNQHDLIEIEVIRNGTRVLLVGQPSIQRKLKAVRLKPLDQMREDQLKMNQWLTSDQYR